ncbi:AAA family ATPase [Amycolatopsis anabasis]|uniref:AAA family ATPase n=1 Tax=Amycolatopsis anabasis TaxID=1840409 RepID=UPI00131DDD22|nr:AAA family ATPase [Amycolatopsis anabasis]
MTVELEPVNGTAVPDLRHELAARFTGGHANRLSGRAAELRILEQQLAAIERGPVVLVEGGMGTGKTALLRAGARAARERGFRVLQAACSSYEADFPLQLVRRLGDGVLRDAAPSGDAADGRAALREAGALLFERIRELARLRPVLLVVDDLQWCDLGSLHCLAFLVRRLTGHSVGILASRLSGSQSADPVLVDELLRAHHPCVRINLEPLGETATGILLEAALGLAAAGQRPAVTRWTGGNPFLLGEVLSVLTRHGEAGTPVTEIAPPSVHTWLRSRVPAAPRCLDVLRALAILGSQATTALIAATAGIPVLEAAQAVRTLADLGLIRPGEVPTFTQPMVRAAVLNAIPLEERARLYLSGAERLREVGTPDDKVIAYLLASHAVEYSCTTDLLLAAVRRMVEGKPVHERVVRLRHVLSHHVSAGVRAQLLPLLGEAELDLDPVAAEARLAEAHRLTSEPVARGRIAFQRATALHALDRGAEAVDLLRTAAEELARSGRNAGGLRDRMAVHLAALAADDPESASAAPPERLAEPARRIVAVLSGTVPGDTAPPLNDAWQLLRPADPLGLPVAWLALTRALISAGARTRILPYATAWAAARNQGPLREGLARAAHAEILLLLGQVEPAAAESTVALSRLSALGAPRPRGVLALALPPLIETLVERDELDAAVRVLSEAGLDGELPPRRDHAPLLVSRGKLRYAYGDAESGLADMVSAGRCEAERGGTPALVSWRAAAVPALVELGRQETARELAQAELVQARGRVHDRPALGVALRAAGQAAGGAAGVELLGESVTVLEESGAPLELARSLGELGTALCRLGRLPGARDRLRRACALAEKAGAIRLRRLLERQLRDAGGRVRGRIQGLESLTASERRIARLAAAGRTNREIAEELFVTRRAVEMHLTQIYRKLDIRGRRELNREWLGRF